MMHQLLIILVLYLQGVKTLNLMLETNKTLFSVLYWNLNVICETQNLFKALFKLQYADDLKFLGSAEYLALPQKGIDLSTKGKLSSHIVTLGN
jgi:hypothetical protein